MFRLNELVRYQTEVCYVGLEVDGMCRVKSRKEDDCSLFDETYDAVVVCCGHYFEPRIANVPGIELWPGRQVHSHSYRTPEPYRDQVVVLIGGSASAVDICQEIAEVAKEVHVATRSERGRKVLKLIGHGNIFVHPMIERSHEDGTVAFEDGSAVLTNVIIHCTGYKYHYPFLHTGGAVKVDDNRVGPLYKHVFPPALAPRISFVGIPYLTVPFHLFELQSKWIAGILSEKIILPSEEKMLEDVEAWYSNLEARGVPKLHTHNILDIEFKYEEWLAKECGCPPMEQWRKSMSYESYIKIISRPGTYRDEIDHNEDLVLQAYQDFEQYLSANGNTNTTMIFLITRGSKMTVHQPEMDSLLVPLQGNMLGVHKWSIAYYS